MAAPATTLATTLANGCSGCGGEHGDMLQHEQCVLSEIGRRVTNHKAGITSSALAAELSAMRGRVMVLNRNSATIDNFDRESARLMKEMDDGWAPEQKI